MKTTNMLYARAGATAIAAVLALSSTPVAAQDVPAPTEPVVVAPPATSTPAPEAAPVTETGAPTAEPAAKATAKPAATKRTTVPKRTTVATAAKPAASRAVARAATPAVVASAAPVAAPDPTPIVDPAPPETAAPVIAPAPVASNGIDERAIELGAGALGIIALGGAAWAMSRRRRRVTEEESWTDETYEPVVATTAQPIAEPIAETTAKPVTSTLKATPRHDPVSVPQPLIVAPPLSAFNWGNPQPSATTTINPATDIPAVDERTTDDHQSGETWVERAQRGPTPDNPSLSLRKRLKRAAFFDKREREVAAGMAPKVEPDAGLPDNIDTRELEAA